MRVEFEIPVPPSTKNSRRLLKRGRRTIVAKGKAAMRAIPAIQRTVLERLRELDVQLPPGSSLFGDDDIAVYIEHRVETDTVSVVVYSAGDRPKRGRKTGRKRDLQNLQEGILDALQGILFENDNQVTHLTMRRKL
jgi:Holliday junction resolvase RusA-like endonuclease